MPSERIQRQINVLLDEVEAAALALDWGRVRELCDGVLRLDHENEDARAFLEAASHDTGVTSRRAEFTFPSSQPHATTHPTSFARGRYEVRRFLGEGGKKRVFLAHDTRLDRDVAFALIKTDGLDEVGRERIVREAQAMGRLGAHPHIVTIFEIGQEGGSPYVVSGAGPSRATCAGARTGRSGTRTARLAVRGATRGSSSTVHLRRDSRQARIHKQSKRDLRRGIQRTR